MNMRFTLRQIEVFAAVAREQSVSKAALSLSLSQSATSAALGELERQFDQPLFDRHGRSLRINEAGRQLLPRAVDLLDRAAEIEAMLRGGSMIGSLHIGATLTIGNYLATLIVADYLRAHPESRVRLEVHNTARILEQLLNFELDLGLIEGPCQDPDLEVETWVADELVVFCSPAHRMAGAPAAKLVELAGEPWILRERGSGTRETLDHAVRHHQGALDVRVELEHTEAIKRAVESGIGIGCISRLALRDAFRRGSLAAIELPELDLRRKFQFAWHRRKYPSAAMRAFLALCRQFTAGVERSDQIALPAVP